MLLHVRELCRLGYNRITIITCDTDVVVIALYAFWFLNIVELWVEFSSGKDKRWIPLHLYDKALGEELCTALPFWFAFTGCDRVSQFASRGKRIFWSRWS